MLWIELAFNPKPMIGAVISAWPDVDALVYDLRFKMSNLQLLLNRNLLDVLEHTVETVRIDDPLEVWYDVVFLMPPCTAFRRNSKF